MTPQMPANIKGMILSAFRNKDVESIVYFNRIWFNHVREVVEEKNSLNESEK